VIYGENRSFDHLFATYSPRHGETVRNALSEGIIDDLGRPGPNFEKAAQYQASDITTFSIAPSKTGPYVTPPPPQTGGAPTAASDRLHKVIYAFNGEGGHRTKGVSSCKLWSALHEVDRYRKGQSACLVNYAEHHRAGLRVGTSITEGSANFLVNRRMNKSQQMR
jgi:hypothetical protein